METELERLIVRLVGDASSYQNMLTQAQVSTKQVAQQVETASGRIQGLGNSLQGFGQNALGVLGQLGIAMSIGGIATQAIRMAAETERMEVSFGVMLGNMQDGASMVKELQTLAANTPFELPTLLSSTKMLLQFGVVADDIMPTLKMLGDVSGGDAAKMSSLSYAFGQITSTGRLMGQDLLQLINAGFNPLQEISKKTGRSMADLKADMEKGAISAEMVKGAFKDATSEGGRFFGFMEKSSQDVMGLFSTMKDDIGGALRELGFELIESLNLKEVLKGVSAFAKSITEFFKGLPPDVKKFLGVLIGITGAIAAASAAYMLFSPLVTATYATAAAGVTKFIGLLSVQTASSVAAWGAYAAGAALAVAAAVAVAYAGFKVGESLREWLLPQSLLDDMKNFNAEMDRADKLNQKLNDRFGKQTESIKEQAAALEGGEKKSFLEKELARAKLELGGIETGLKNANREVAKVDGWGNRLIGDSTLKALRAEAVDAAAKVELAKTRVQELQDALKKEQAPAQDQKLLDNLKKITEKYEDEGRLIGKTGVEAEIAKAGFDKLSESQLENLRAVAAMNEEYKETVKQEQALVESVEKFKAELKEQADFFGLTAEEAKLKRFQMEGLDEAELEMLRGMVKNNKQMKDRDKLMKEGMETTKKYMTPMEKFKERVDELNKQLDAGGLTNEAYGLAIQEAEKELNNAGNTAKRTREEIEKLEATLTGSADASKRIAKYMEMLRGGKMTGMGIAQSDDAEIRRKAGERANRVRDMREELLSGMARTQGSGLLKGLGDLAEDQPKMFNEVVKRSAVERKAISKDGMDLIKSYSRLVSDSPLSKGLLKPQDITDAARTFSKLQAESPLSTTWFSDLNREIMPQQVMDQPTLSKELPPSRGTLASGEIDPRWRELLDEMEPKENQAKVQAENGKQTALLTEAVVWLKDIAKKGGFTIGGANL